MSGTGGPNIDAQDTTRRVTFTERRAGAAALGFVDVELSCCDCGQSFTLEAGEQVFYEEKGFVQPRRCFPCRKTKRAHFLDGRIRWQPPRPV